MSAHRDATLEEIREVAEAVRAQDLPRAVELARGNLDAGTFHPMFLNLRAYWHEQQGRIGDAFADLGEARKSAPNDPIILNAFGLCAARLGRMDEAFGAFDAAAQADPSFPQAHFNGAWAAEALGELDRARAGYKRAIELAPQAAEAHASLAWLAARTASWEEARAAAAAALALAPGRPIAHLALATADLNEGNADAAEAHIREVLSQQTLSRLDRGIAFGLLGDCMDRRGSADAAFEAFLQSNTLFRQEYGEQISSRSHETVSSMVTWLNAYFAAARPQDWQSQPRKAAAGGPSAHVFLIGFPRSGTTLLEQVLASHPSVVSMDEKEALADGVIEYMRSPATLDRLRHAGDGELEAARHKYWARVRGFGLEPRAKIFVDKLALNTIKLPLIARLFPDAKVLLALRDPRDVVWGCFRQRFQMNAAMLEFTSLEGAGRLYAGCMGLLATYMKVFALDIHAIRNEDLVANFDLEARQVCDFIGAPWDDALRTFAERRHQRSISTPSSTQVARGLYASGGQWRPYARQLQPILPLLQPWVERFGYAGG